MNLINRVALRKLAKDNPEMGNQILSSFNKRARPAYSHDLKRARTLLIVLKNDLDSIAYGITGIENKLSIEDERVANSLVAMVQRLEKMDMVLRSLAGSFDPAFMSKIQHIVDMV